MDCSLFIHIVIFSLMSRGFCAVHIVDTTTTITDCPKPTSSPVITKQNQNGVDIDVSNYDSSQTRLPLVCHKQDDYELKKPAFATCKDGEWVKEEEKCLPKIWREREKTKQIIFISGLVFGGLALVFIILQLIQHRWEKTHKKRIDDVERKSMVVPVLTTSDYNNYSEIPVKSHRMQSQNGYHPAYLDRFSEMETKY